VGEIRPDNSGFSSMCESKSKIPGSAAEIENEGIGTVENGFQSPRSARAPEPIELQRKNMIEQIVARGDLREHLANFIGSIGFCDGTFGASPLDGRGDVSHGALAKACRLQ
jgi:hypothetical protein